MIRINLLPHREEKRKARRQQFYALTGLTLVLGGLIVALGNGIISGYVSAQDEKNAFLKTEIAALDKSIDEIKRLREQTDALLQRKRVIESLQGNRSEAVGLFNELAKNVPEGVYIKKVSQQANKINLVGLCAIERAGVQPDAESGVVAAARAPDPHRNQGRHRRQAPHERIQPRSVHHACGGRGRQHDGEGAQDMKQIQMPQIDFTRIADDFKNLDPKDVGNWPTAPKAAVLLGVLVATLAAGWWFLWDPLRVELEQKRVEEQTLKDEWLNKKRQAVNLEQYQQQLADIDKSFGALLKQLPNKAEMESLLVDISQAGLSRGLQFETWKPGSEAVKDFYAEMPITIRVTGGYHDLGNFAGDVAKLSRIVTLGSIVIDSSKDGLKMDAVATTYRYLDDEEIARIKKAKADKAKGANK